MVILLPIQSFSFFVVITVIVSISNSMMLRTVILISILTISASVKAQLLTSADDLFKAARNASFEEKNDRKAMQLARLALERSPEYADIEVFLGRLYSWNKQPDSAALHFDRVIGYSPKNEDVYIAYTDLEYWYDDNQKALNICNKGLLNNSNSTDLLFRKAKILNAMKQYREASAVVDKLLKLNRHNSEVLALASSLKDADMVNKVSLNYNFTHFDKQFDKPWHLSSLSYGRQTKLGSVSGTLTYANRFGGGGYQGEVEMYPHINKTFYSYLEFGYSGNGGLFPNYRFGFSVYANLPLSFEAEGGLRYLNFGSSTYVYTAYVGKYYSNFLFGFRTYMTPGSAGTSHSYSITGRYYLKGADDYLGLSIGSGISPDDKRVNIQYNVKSNLTSRQASASFYHSFNKRNIISFGASLLNQEYKLGVKDNQVDLSVGFQRRF